MLDGMPEHLRYYFDYEAFARDMELNGDVTGFRSAGRDWVIERI
jgi:antirestriction protein